MLVFWLLFVVWGGLVGAQEDCYPYYLDNECQEVVSWTAFDEEQQIQRFNQIKLTISDIRMARPKCRRPTIYLLCVATFGIDCINSSAIFPPPGVLGAFCKELGENCFLADNNCSFSSSPSLESSSLPLEASSFEFPDEFLPIPVTSCTDGFEDITCCFPPYGFDSAGECVVACAPPFFSEDKDRTFLIQMYVYLGLTTIVVLFSLIPLFVTPGSLRFPKYCLPLSIVFYLIFLHSHAWGLYVYPENFLCDGHDNYFVAYADLIDSPTCIAQSIMFYFFMILAEYWMMVMAMSLSQLAFSQSGQADPLTTFVNKLFKKDKAELGFWIVGLLLASFVGFGGTFIAQSNDLISLDGPWQACSLNPKSTGLIPYIVVAILLGLSLFFFVFFTFSLVRRSWMFLRIHFRIFVFLLLMMVLFFSFLIYVLVYIGDYKYQVRLQDWTFCVASQPRIEDSGCKLPNSHFYYIFSWVYGTVYLTMFLVCVVVYMSNPLLYRWWKTLICERKIIKMNTRDSVGTKSDPNLMKGTTA